MQVGLDSGRRGMAYEHCTGTFNVNGLRETVRIYVMMLFVRRNMEILRHRMKPESCRVMKSLQSMRRTAGAIFVLGCVSVGSLLGSSITVGTDNGGNDFPFGGPFFSNPGTVYQEAYASTDFSAPELITGIDFFEQAGFTGSIYSGTYTLSLSMISASIGSLSTTNLASNLGADNTVFDTVVLSGTAPSKLTFTGTPFLYDPSQGNLLLNISITGGSGGKGVAFQDNEGVGTSVARYQNFGSNNGLGWGLVTEFDSLSGGPAVPEPGTMSLFGCGMAAVLLVKRLRRS